MSDFPCIYEMNMLEENSQMEQDLLAGRGMDVIFCLMDHLKSRQEIATKLGMPNYSVQLYLQRLIKAGLVKEEVSNIQNGQLERSYSLVSDEIEIMNRIYKNGLSEAEKMRKVELSAQHFANMTRNAIKNVNLNPQKPHKIKMYLMKAKKEGMESFQKEIDLLFKKYKAVEDLDATDTYSLFSVLAPYEMEE